MCVTQAYNMGKDAEAQNQYCIMQHLAHSDAFIVIQMDNVDVNSIMMTPVYIQPAVSAVSVQSSKQIWNHMCWQILNALKTQNGLQGMFHIQNKLNSVHCIGDAFSPHTKYLYLSLRL